MTRNLKDSICSRKHNSLQVSPTEGSKQRESVKLEGLEDKKEKERENQDPLTLLGLNLLLHFRDTVAVSSTPVKYVPLGPEQELLKRVSFYPESPHLFCCYRNSQKIPGTANNCNVIEVQSRKFSNFQPSDFQTVSPDDRTQQQVS